MNEFTVKKLAEVEAFLQLSADITKRAGSDFDDSQPVISAQLNDLPASTEQAVPDKLQGLLVSKQQATTAKLTTMMELYIGDEWDNPVEVLEWLSFYCGAAAAHATLAHNALGDSDQKLVAIDKAYMGLLDSVKAALAVFGSARAA